MVLPFIIDRNSTNIYRSEDAEYGFIACEYCLHGLTPSYYTLKLLF